MENLFQDISFGMRMLLKHRAFTAVAVLSLAIGIGANSAIFSVVDTLLLRPLPYAESDRLAILWSRSPGLNVDQDWFSPGQYLDVKTQNNVFDQTAVAIGGSFNLTGQGGPEHVDAVRVSSSFFPLMGGRAILGRAFSEEEDIPGKGLRAVLSHGFWQRRFGGDPGIIGKTVNLSGNNAEIIGVLPAGFALTRQVMPTVSVIERADLFLPLPFSETARNNRNNEDFNILARLKPGVSFSQAQADMDLIASRMKQQFPQNYPPTSGLTISVVPLRKQVVGETDFIALVLFGAVALVLLIACANVANLLLSQSAVRGKETAIRTAVGASRIRVMRQLLTESVLLGILGGIGGVIVSVAAIQALKAFGPSNIPRLAEIGVDLRVLSFTFVVTLLTGIIFGLSPALRTSKVDLNEALKEGGRTASGAGSAPVGHHLTSKMLVIIEVALSLVLLLGAGLLIRSYQRIGDAKLGFDENNVLSMRLSIPAAKYKTPEVVNGFFQQVSERIRSLPGVQSAAITYSLPMSTTAFAWEPVTAEGYVPRAEYEITMSNVRIVSPQYFETMRVAMVKGRLFTDQDTKDAPDTAIVDEAFVQKFWPGQSAIGRKVKRFNSDTWRTVVGVISDAKEYSSEKEPPISIYYPAYQLSPRGMFLVVRTSGEPLAMSGTVTNAIREIDPEMPVYDVDSMEHRLSDFLAPQRFSMTLFGVFAFVALALAAIGIYGVMSNSVSHRTHEIGIRMALGARPRDVLGLVVRQGMLLVAAGTAIGAVVAVLVARLAASLLYGVSAGDPLTLLVVSAVLAIVALVACYLPARRAASVDPMVALRTE